ncbi:hypothetical protein F5Y15DRAFT_294666 [Xylariaceae sp. FL0016]|nr:hypothetical protein F5Y15DRAFT_294666 [Xylariaceae sp. FL0016]
MIQKPEFVNVLRESWSSAPQEVKSFIRGIVQKPRSFSSPTGPIKLSTSITGQLKVWEKDPRKFFDRESFGNDILRLYRYIDSLGEPKLFDTFRRRVALVAVHKIKEHIGDKNIAKRLAGFPINSDEAKN